MIKRSHIMCIASLNYYVWLKLNHFSRCEFLRGLRHRIIEDKKPKPRYFPINGGGMEMRYV